MPRIQGDPKVMTRLLTVVGARPQFIKAAPVSRALRAAGVGETLLHTGQHFDEGMSAIFFQELQIPEPAYHLGVSGGGHGAMTGRMLERIEEVLLADRPDAVLVYGDTNSTLAGALAAAKLHIPVLHVEAGLRSFRRTMPEEVNRVMTDHLATLLFCPTQAAIAHLRQEGITKGVLMVGDVMHDASLMAAAVPSGEAILGRLTLTAGSYAVATVHRAENTDDPGQLAAVIDYLRVQAKNHPVVLPLHPRTRAACERFGLGLEGLTIIAPVGYLEMTHLIRNASLVLTDSGGLQKEAYFHRVPCVTLRDETEWTETVSAGWNRLWKGPDFVSPRQEIADYGDGRAADRIAEAVAAYFDGGAH